MSLEMNIEELRSEIRQNTLAMEALTKVIQAAAQAGALTPQVQAAAPVAAETSTAAVAPAQQDAPPANPFMDPTTQLDKRGYYWDSRIHSEAVEPFKADGTWKMKRGVDKSLIPQVEAEQDGQRMAAQQGAQNAAPVAQGDNLTQTTPVEQPAVAAPNGGVMETATTGVAPTSAPAVAPGGPAAPGAPAAPATPPANPPSNQDPSLVINWPPGSGAEYETLKGDQTTFLELTKAMAKKYGAAVLDPIFEKYGVKGKALYEVGGDWYPIILWELREEDGNRSQTASA